MYKWGWYSTLHACIFKWRIKCNPASEKIFQKMIGRLYKANTCLSNLIFLPLIFPLTFMKYACFSFPVFFQNAGSVYASMEWTPLQTGGESLGMDASP